MLFLIAYISSVVLINYAFSTAPHLDIIWSAWGGLVFVLRDMVQTRFGHGAIAAMLAALVLSYVTSDPSIALASATAFAVSECIDWLVFSITKRPLHDRLWISSALSIPRYLYLLWHDRRVHPGRDPHGHGLEVRGRDRRVADHGLALAQTGRRQLKPNPLVHVKCRAFSPWEARGASLDDPLLEDLR